jgi:hypothetical protein
MTEGEPKPRKAITMKPTSTVAVRGPSPLDETGFLKDGKLNDKLYDAVTCACVGCRKVAVSTIFEAGIRQEQEAENVLLKYIDVASKVHQAKVRP